MSDLSSPLLEDAQNFAREQVDSVWRRQLERLQQIVAAWPLEIERALEGTKADLTARLEHQYRELFQECSREAARHAREQISAEVIGYLNQSVRRLCAWTGEEDWSAALIDGTQRLCHSAALFTVNHGLLHLEAARNIGGEHPLSDIPIESAPAFAAVVDTRDTIVAMRIERELSPGLAAYLGQADVGQADDAKFHLFPIVAGGRVAALLYTTGGSTQVESLELLAAVAGAVLAAHSAPSARKGELINIASAQPQSEVNSWSLLSEADREVHRKAQRYARVQIARLRLYNSSAVKSGRAEGNLYTALKEEIDAARGEFRREFIAKSGTMVDYLHLEVVQTLANNEVQLLGPNYPGPMA